MRNKQDAVTLSLTEATEERATDQALTITAEAQT